jgi:hypothetical protein
MRAFWTFSFIFEGEVAGYGRISEREAESST